jgi:hypothetical protein
MGNTIDIVEAYSKQVIPHAITLLSKVKNKIFRKKIFGLPKTKLLLFLL